MSKNDKGEIWVCLTDMAKVSGRLVGDWMRLKSSKDLLKELSGSMGNHIDTLTHTFGSDHPNDKRGTWAIQEVAIEFAGWCSVSFKVWTLGKLKTLMNEGSVSLHEPELPKTYLEALKHLVVSEEQKLALQAQVEEQQALIAHKDKTIEAQQDIIVEWHPMVKNYQQFMDATSLISFQAAAKMLPNTGRTRLFNVMRMLGIIVNNPPLIGLPI
jgi:hypothetical protein